MENFKPVLRFMVVSDIHIKDYESPERERFAKAIRDAYKIARSSDSYKKLDAVAVVGDFADNGSRTQFEAAKKITDENIDFSETKLIISVASHEFHSEGEIEGAYARLKEFFGVEPDVHEVINGFHFVSVTPSHATNYNDGKKKWMAENLEAAAVTGRRKPIFVFQHPHNTDTVYGSMLWGEDDLMPIYVNYPQIIHFSGHSHAPINDPRSIHQQHFTSLGTGTLSYFELDEFDKFYGTKPPRKEEAAQMLIVEADADNRVRVYPYDILTGNYFPQVWEIDAPSDPQSFKYTREIRMKAAGLPYFEKGAYAKTVSVGKSSAEIEFSQAKIDTDPFVNSYDIRVKNADGDIVKVKSIWSEYYFYNMPEKLTVDFDGLESGKEYTAEIRANSFWNTSSEDILKVKFTTEV